MCQALIIDNFDSFTYNIFQQMGQVCGVEPTVVKNTTALDAIDFSRYDCIVISPGPGTPAVASDVGISADVIRDTELPLLGVCLGHQCLGHLHGMEVGLAPEPMHGRVNVIHHDGRGVFRGLPADLAVVRYHSLVVRQVREPFELCAWGDDGVIHGIRHRTRPLHGVQFHPESISTEAGIDLFRNFRDIALEHKRQRAA
ncbi:anthranilate synthase component II [Burkholderia plantarii]|uniref:anthranilate synthase component II n=1 Tax=Burkholderia plantarii TaxID=41899 RepID=UPI0006D8A91C|nr:aminodeoxychorismate/anthranilate synthase component II [Burkholderia plantarii]ALK30220.1 para-aminobenzoate synthase [Burkholderia plantarii]WLE58945.1 aminodeoxychorismate/anthranilate synthase component II [Burkholderia plantarii]GLZ18327.1 glutamine amidotransferase [Burkholderia plantarii]